MQQSYKIYFDGEIASNFNPEEVKKRAQAVFRLSDDKTTILFNGTQHVLKEHLTEQECVHFLGQLLDIGLIAKSDPALYENAHDETSQLNTQAEMESSESKDSSNSESTEQTKKQSKILPATLLLSIVAGGTLYAWQSGYIEVPFLKDDNTVEQPIAITPPKPNHTETINQDIEKSTSNQAPTDIPKENITNTETPLPSPLIEECTHSEVTRLLDKVLAQGLPQLVQRSSPNVNLTIQTYDNNQELYFDESRNKRLCGVLAQYSVEAPDIPSNLDEPSVVYEIIYEIQKEEDNSIRLNTFRQKIISSNLQTPSNAN